MAGRFNSSTEFSDCLELKGMLTSLANLAIEGYCQVPEKYRNANFAQIESPSQEQAKTIKLLELMASGDSRFCTGKISLPPIRSAEKNPATGEYTWQEVTSCDPARPKIGVYLWGLPGKGKSHIMFAYANSIIQRLNNSIAWDTKSEAEMKSAVLLAHQKGLSLSEAQKRFMEVYGTSRRDSEERDSLELNELKRAREFFERIAEDLSKKLSPSRSRKDVFVLPFDVLMRLYETDRNIVEQAIQAPVLMVDDIYLKEQVEDEESIKEARAGRRVVQRMLEDRYNAGARATFITSNISPEELITPKNAKDLIDPMLAKRLLNRTKEMFYIVKFGEKCLDFREEIEKRRIKEIDDILGVS